MLYYTLLPHRGLLRLSGEDCRDFLQSLITNDVNKVRTDRAIWAALLTPQGKFLHEFFITAQGADMILEAESARLADLERRFALYRLRAKVTSTPLPDTTGVYALFGEGVRDFAEDQGLVWQKGATAATTGGLLIVDPRDEVVGLRFYGQAGALSDFRQVPLAAYDQLRLSAGLPDGSRDLEIEKSILLEAGFAELGGIDWEKGCYVGQELTARTRYRGLIKQRLVPVKIEGPLPAFDSPIFAGEKEVGRLRSSSGTRALALVRSEALAKANSLPWHAGESLITPEIPAWFDWSFTKGRD